MRPLHIFGPETDNIISEDEDAPSPLTKRLSSLGLSRQSSLSSLRASHPLSRSYSGEDAPYKGRLKGYSSLPPTSWQPRPNGQRASSSTSSLDISGSSSPLRPSGMRFSEPNPGILTIALDGSKDKDSDMWTPSTASTLSLSVPATPEGADTPHRLWDRDKILPPLPRRMGSMASLRYSSRPDLRLKAESTSVLQSNRATRPESPASSSSSVGASMGHIAPVTPQASSRVLLARRPSMTPRPLRLTASLSTSMQPSEPTPKAGIPSVNSRSLHAQQRSRAVSGPPSPASRHGRAWSPQSAPPVPVVDARYSLSTPSHTPPTSPPGTAPLADAPRKPRTGTGMVYRKSSTTALSQTRMRVPSTVGYHG